MRSFFIEPYGRAVFPRSDGILRLVAVALTGFRGRQRHSRDLLPAEPPQSVGDAVRFDCALRLIVKMPEVAAAALLGIGAQAVDTVRRPCYYFFNPAVRGGFSHMDDTQLVFLVRCGVGDKNGAALHTADAQSLTGKAADCGAVNLVLFQHGRPRFCFT